MKKTAFFVLVLLSPVLTAQTVSPPREWILGLHADATKYYGDFTDNRFSSGGMLSLKRYLTPLRKDEAFYAQVALGGYDIQWRVTEKMFTVFDTTQNKVGDKNRAFLAPLQFQAFWRKLIGPQGELFLGTGLEFTYFSPQDPNGTSLHQPQEKYGKWTVGIPLTADFDFVMSDHLALNFHSTLHYTFTDYLDGFAGKTGTDVYLTAGLGLSYSFPPPDTDSDFDGLTNRQEREIYRTNPNDPDTDHDGLTDKEEIEIGTSPLVPDTDKDGLSDGDEVRKWGTNPLSKDTDGDGLTDLEETALGTSPLHTDTDGDGLNDKIEIARGTDPRNRDTDGDGLPDGLEYTSSPIIRDTDGDGLPDGEETAYGLRPYDEDFDGDGLFDALEIKIGTDPKKPDTDNDGVSDYAEYYGLMTDPRNPDTDGDGVPDGSDPTPLEKTTLNPSKNVSWSFRDLFKREQKVDDMSKGFIMILHLIRSAPKDMLFNIDIAVYGENSGEAAERRSNLEELLKKQTGTWDKPTLSIYSDVKPKGSPHARLTYVWKTGLR